MYYRLPSYDNWYADCYCGCDTPEEPCWGEVYITDEYEMEDGEWDTIYTCEGHKQIEYMKSNLPEDQGAIPVTTE